MYIPGGSRKSVHFYIIEVYKTNFLGPPGICPPVKYNAIEVGEYAIISDMIWFLTMYLCIKHVHGILIVKVPTHDSMSIEGLGEFHLFRPLSKQARDYVRHQKSWKNNPFFSKIYAVWTISLARNVSN